MRASVNRPVFTLVATLLVALSVHLYAQPDQLARISQQPVMAIVIDDIGDNYEKGVAAINLPGAITYAFLPHTPYAFELSNTAHLLGKEVILHAPMENKAGLRLGPGALTRQHSSAELQHILRDDLDAIPHAVGMNNHMGSVLTENRARMEVIMHVAKQRNIFFIDSVTTPRTVAWKVAEEYGIPFLVRDVFLDNRQEWDYIHNQFKQALSLAVAQGYVVVIGHPYPETTRYLSKALPILKQLGVQLVTASELLAIHARSKRYMTAPETVGACDGAEAGSCQQSALIAAKR